MKRNNTVIVFILMVCALNLSGCGEDHTDNAASYQISAAGTWTDGAYTETAKGKNGNFEVTVVIENGNIFSVSIGEHEETPDKGGKAIAQLPDEIIKAQSYEVDAVSGATVTSNGIKNAVAGCLEQASKKNE